MRAVLHRVGHADCMRGHACWARPAVVNRQHGGVGSILRLCKIVLVYIYTHVYIYVYIALAKLYFARATNFYILCMLHVCASIYKSVRS